MSGINEEYLQYSVELLSEAEYLRVPTAAGGPPANTSSGTAYQQNIVHFDGSTWGKGAELGAPESPTGTISVWLRMVSTQKVTVFGDTDQDYEFTWGWDGIRGTQFAFVTLFGHGGSHKYYYKEASYNFTALTNVLFSWDTNHALGSRVYHSYINDVSTSADSDGPGAEDVGATAFTVKSANRTFIGAFFSNDTDYDNNNPDYSYTGDMADFYFDQTFIDLSVTANRRKFISASGQPVSLGANGELPTGAAPKIFLSGNRTAFQTNRGSGPSYSWVGTLTDA
jgi:hypothetical protein